MKILIVEDNQDGRLILKKIFENAGHQVETAIHGEDALFRLESFFPDCIISDILMPVMDGFKLCYQVKNDKHLQHIPFIFYTATYTDPEDERLAYGLGASRFIIKPIDNEKILRVIDEVVAEVDEGEFGARTDRAEGPHDALRGYDEALARKLEKKVSELDLYREVFVTAIDGVAVTTPEGVLQKVNPAFSRMFGCEATYLGNTTTALFVGEENFSDCLRRMKAAASVIGACDAAGCNGKKLSVEYVVTALHDAGGKPTALVWTFKDTTRRSEAESEKKDAEMRERKARKEWDRTFDAVQDVVTMQDMEMRLTKVNKAAGRIMGKSLSELVGQHCYEVFRGADTPCPGCPVPHSIKDFSSYSAEIEHPNIGKVFQVTAVPIANDNGEIDCIAHFAKDISEQKRLEVQYLHAQKMEAIGRLAGGIAHDFNNLLTTIIGYSQLLLMQMSEDSPFVEGIKAIHDAGNRAVALTRQLLTMSRKQLFEMRPVAIDEVVASFAKMIGRMIGEDINLHIHTEAAESIIMADETQLDQVLMNLAVNARDAMPQGGELMIATQSMHFDDSFCLMHKDVAPGHYVALEITDTGEGMSKDVQEKIFEPFFTTKDQGKGTGLGLATVYGIIKQHKGFINVYSEVGKGTTFRVYFPAISDEFFSNAGTDTSGDFPRGEETILIVDDDEQIRKLTADVLRPLGYTVLEASNGAEALNCCRGFQGEIHLLLIDIVMPGMSGVVTAKLIRECKPGIKIFFMSGYPLDFSLQGGALLEDTQYFQKPIMPSVLARQIREHLGNGCSSS